MKLVLIFYDEKDHCWLPLGSTAVHSRVWPLSTVNLATGHGPTPLLGLGRLNTVRITPRYPAPLSSFDHVTRAIFLRVIPKGKRTKKNIGSFARSVRMTECIVETHLTLGTQPGGLRYDILSVRAFKYFNRNWTIFNKE